MGGLGVLKPIGWRRGQGEREEKSRFQQLSSPPTDVSRWPGERGPLTEAQRDTCERQNQTLTNVWTHTAVKCIVRLSSAVSS